MATWVYCGPCWSCGAVVEAKTDGAGTAKCPHCGKQASPYLLAMPAGTVTLVHRGESPQPAEGAEAVSYTEELAKMTPAERVREQLKNTRDDGLATGEYLGVEDVEALLAEHDRLRAIETDGGDHLRHIVDLMWGVYESGRGDEKQAARDTIDKIKAALAKALSREEPKP